MKQEYSKPRMEAVELAKLQLLADSITDIISDTGLKPEGGGDGTGGTIPRARLFDDPVWDDLLGE